MLLSKLQRCLRLSCKPIGVFMVAMFLLATGVDAQEPPVVEPFVPIPVDRVQEPMIQAPAIPGTFFTDANKDDSKVTDQSKVTAQPKATSGTLQFSFNGTPWREVIDWLASEGDLALHVNDLPTGSFTYSDPTTFTHQDALDRVNLFLLPQGFTLVRSGKLLTAVSYTHLTLPTTPYV